MGNEFVSDSLPDTDTGGRSAAPAPLTYTKQFEEAFPFYLSIEMSADEYWNQDCSLVKGYRKAYEMKNERRKNQMNEELWLQGLYFYEALLDASPLLHAFAKPGTKPLPYPKEPFPRSTEEAKEREERDRQLRFERMRANLFARASKNQKS